MLALDAKRGVEATLERVYKNTGRSFDKLSITWNGRTAGVSRTKNAVHVIFPNVDETKQVETSLFNQLIGYALHELGHLWFTTDKAWDKAREEHGAFVSSLINGLEDPRIEQCVVDSGYAPNSRSLFEHLTNQVLIKSGYVEPDDFKNIPFMLAIEGRRLNGYDICFPSIVGKSPYAKHLRWALKAAQSAKDTPKIVKIAIELYRRLNEQRQQEQQPDQQDQQEQQQDQPSDSSEPSADDDDGDGQGQGGGDKEGDQEGDGQGGGQGDGDDGEGDQGKPSNKPSDKPGSGSGWSDKPGRPVEPNDHISNELSSIASKADEYRERPHAGKPVYQPIKFD
jgi:hypothetical protein